MSELLLLLNCAWVVGALCRGWQGLCVGGARALVKPKCAGVQQWLVCNGGLCANRCKQWLSDAAWVSETTYVRKTDLDKLGSNWPISATHVFTQM